MAAQRGLVAIFAALSHKSPSSRLGKHDELGMSMIHYAAMYNRPEILSTLVLQLMDINLRKLSSVVSQGNHIASGFKVRFYLAGNQLKVLVHSLLQNIYIAPLQDKYLEVLPSQPWSKRTVLKCLQNVPVKLLSRGLPVFGSCCICLHYQILFTVVSYLQSVSDAVF